MSEDVFVGLDNPTQEEWERWHRTMLAERTLDLSLYDDARTAWSDTTFRQYFWFLYDRSFDIERALAKFGRIDEVVLWAGYPRLGFDARTQFDFYRQMKLRRVSDDLHARGIRVVVAYNPWDAGTYEELAELVADLDADAVMLDTMPDVPDALIEAVRGVVFMPELRMKREDLERARQSWAQWFELGEGPSIYRNRWLAPRHRPFAIARWDTSRKRDIVFSFFNGAGLVIWENVFGTHNPYSKEDRRLIAETAAVIDRYGDLFVHGTWLPLVPTGVSGLDANRFVSGARAITTFRNRTTRPLSYVAREACWACWARRELAPGDVVTIAAEGTEALVVGEPVHFSVPDFPPEIRSAPVLVPPPPITSDRSSAKMIDLPGGTFDMRITHERRECGCYGEHTRGWNYKDVITHTTRVELEPFAIRALPVKTGMTLAEARAFAASEGHRLPTEAEWQWAAEHGAFVPDLWELTESEYSDGHVRFVMLRGGLFLPERKSEWLLERGAIDSHAKYILMGTDLDRSDTITFRTVAPLSRTL